MKTIYLEPDEEIISVIDRLTQTKSKEISFVVPAGAQIWQNSINLRLLKREADGLGKELTLFVPDDLKAEVAEKVGFIVKREKNLPIELIREEKEQDKNKESAKEDMIGLLVEELKPEREADVLLEEESIEDGFKSEKGSSLINQKYGTGKKRGGFHWPNWPSKEPRKRMVDIVRPGNQVGYRQQNKESFFPQRFLKKKPIRPVSGLKPIEVKPFIRERVWQETKGTEAMVSSRWPKFLIIFIILAFLVAGLVGYLVLPTTKISLSPKIEKVSFDLVVIGSKDISQIDESLNKLPLQEIKVEKTKSKEFSASGEKELNEKAQGRLTVYNEYSSSPQTLVATTRFESPEGKIFRIEKNIVVPGAEIEEGKIIASTIEVEVVADQPGSDYNIGSTNFVIPGFKGTAKYAGFYAESKSPMTGGYKGKVKVVSAEDLEKAEEGLAEELKNEVKQTLQEQIPTDLKLVEQGLKEKLTKISTVKKGAEADNFNVEMNASIQALFFQEEDLKRLVDLNLVSQVEENKAPLSESQQIDYREIITDWAEEEVTFNLYIEEEVAWQIDIVSLKSDLAGQNEVEVRKYLANQPEIEKAKVTFWPFWVKRIPLQEKKIEIEIDLDLD